MHYSIKHQGDGLIKIGFIPENPADNTVLVQEAHEASLNLKGDSTLHGKLIRINGAASLPVAMAIASNLAHISPAIACFDPKLGAYVVAISHSPNFKVGDLIN